MPYLETRIETDLRNQKRLKGIPGFLDYDFNEIWLDDFYNYLSDCFKIWLNAPEGLSNISKWARIYLTVFSFYHGNHDGIQYLSDELNRQISTANRYMLEVLRKLSAKFKSLDYDLKSDKELVDYQNAIEEKHKSSLKNITEIIRKVELYSLTRGFFAFR